MANINVIHLDKKKKATLLLCHDAVCISCHVQTSWTFAVNVSVVTVNNDL